MLGSDVLGRDSGERGTQSEITPTRVRYGECVADVYHPGDRRNLRGAATNRTGPCGVIVVSLRMTSGEAVSITHVSYASENQAE
jgi:hypothetical protein